MAEPFKPASWKRASAWEDPEAAQKLRIQERAEVLADILGGLLGDDALEVLDKLDMAPEATGEGE